MSTEPVIAYVRCAAAPEQPLKILAGRGYVIGRADPPRWSPDVALPGVDARVSRRAVLLKGLRAGLFVHTAAQSGDIQIAGPGGFTAGVNLHQPRILTCGSYTATVLHAGGGSGHKLMIEVVTAEVSPAIPGLLTSPGWTLTDMLHPRPELDWIVIGSLAALLHREPGSRTPPRERLLLALQAWYSTKWSSNGRFPRQLDKLVDELGLVRTSGQDKVPLIGAAIARSSRLTEADYATLRQRLVTLARERLSPVELLALGLPDR